MSILQPDQPVIRAGNGAERVFSLPAQLTIPAIEASMVLSKQPALMVSQTTLLFTQKSTDKPAFLLLKVAQQQADTPVTITTDLPECIQLASDSRPTFGPALTLVPAPTGTYVHVRYFAHKRGFLHKGQLVIQAPYITTTVALEGRMAGVLPAIRIAQPSDNRLIVRAPSRAKAESRWAIGLSVAALISGLTYAGHTYRCQLFPDLCQNTPAVQTVVQHRIPVSDKPDPAAILRYKRTIKNKGTAEADPVISASPRSVSNEVTTRQSVSGNLTGQRTSTRSRVYETPVAKQSTDEPENKQSRRRSVPTPPMEESDLERELNQRVSNN